MEKVSKVLTTFFSASAAVSDPLLFSVLLRMGLRTHPPFCIQFLNFEQRPAGI